MKVSDWGTYLHDTWYSMKTILLSIRQVCHFRAASQILTVTPLVFY